MDDARTRLLAHTLACLGLTIVLAACGPVSPPALTEPPLVATGDSTMPPLKPSPATLAVTLTATPTTIPASATSTAAQGSQPEPAVISATPRPVADLHPCNVDNGLEIYLIIEGQRRHIVDWETFLQLGLKQANIIDCGKAAALPKGAPVTRLVKGVHEPVYLIRGGIRHHIPDMQIFTALGFKVEDITVLPDSILALWPLGDPLDAASGPDVTLFRTFSVGGYTIRLWHPVQGQGMFDYATISQPGQPDIKIEDVEAIGDLPAEDINGDGYPDIAFLIRGVGSAHCCWGTIIYSLTPTPTRILEIRSPAYYGWYVGRGDFKDLDGDGVYEFNTVDPLLKDIPCSQPWVTAILRYDPGQQHYVGASPQFPAYFDNQTIQLTTQPGGVCEIYPLVAQLLYIGRTADAKAAFDRLYTGPDPGGDWASLVSGVQQGRYYAPAG